MFYQHIIQYPTMMETPPPSFGETIYLDKWIPLLQDQQAIRFTAKPQYYPYLFREEKLPPETVNMDKWYFEGVLFNPRKYYQLIVNQIYYPTFIFQRCNNFEWAIKHDTSFTYPGRNTTSYSYPNKNTTSHAYPAKSAEC